MVLLLFDNARDDAIIGNILIPSVPRMPMGRWNTVRAYPEYAPYSQREPSAEIFSVSVRLSKFDV